MDRAGRAIDREHMAVRSVAPGDLLGRGAGTAADLDDAEPGTERQGIDDLLQPW